MCDLNVISKTISIELVKIQKKNIPAVKYIVFRNEANFEICDRTSVALETARTAVIYKITLAFGIFGQKLRNAVLFPNFNAIYSVLDEKIEIYNIVRLKLPN